MKYNKIKDKITIDERIEILQKKHPVLKPIIKLKIDNGNMIDNNEKYKILSLQVLWIFAKLIETDESLFNDLNKSLFYFSNDLYYKKTDKNNKYYENNVIKDQILIENFAKSIGLNKIDIQLASLFYKALNNNFLSQNKANIFLINLKNEIRDDGENYIKIFNEIITINNIYDNNTCVAIKDFDSIYIVPFCESFFGIFDPKIYFYNDKYCEYVRNEFDGLVYLKCTYKGKVEIISPHDKMREIIGPNYNYCNLYNLEDNKNCTTLFHACISSDNPEECKQIYNNLNNKDIDKLWEQINERDKSILAYNILEGFGIKILSYENKIHLFIKDIIDNVTGEKKEYVEKNDAEIINYILGNNINKNNKYNFINSLIKYVKQFEKFYDKSNDFYNTIKKIIDDKKIYISPGDLKKLYELSIENDKLTNKQLYELSIENDKLTNKQDEETKLKEILNYSKTNVFSREDYRALQYFWQEQVDKKKQELIEKSKKTESRVSGVLNTLYNFSYFR